MGSSMAGHLLAGGYSLTVTTRTREKAAGLLEAGATWAETPADVARLSDVIFSMVGYPADVAEVLSGDTGALTTARAGCVIVDMTTSQPSLAVSIAEAASLKGVHVLDAPVSGGDVGARTAALSIMVGGPANVVEAVMPCFSLMGATIVRQGDHGAGQHTKMVNQILVASTTVAMSEGLLYAARAGLDLETVLSSVGSGAAGSWTINNLAPRVLRGDFAPGFFVDHFIKDLAIAVEEADRMGISLPGLENARALYRALQTQGHGQKGTQALILALCELSGLTWPPPPA
jgi:3-hydroxyisobutyrate dehydrogenase